MKFLNPHFNFCNTAAHYLIVTLRFIANTTFNFE